MRLLCSCQTLCRCRNGCQRREGTRVGAVGIKGGPIVRTAKQRWKSLGMTGTVFRLAMPSSAGRNAPCCAILESAFSPHQRAGLHPHKDLRKSDSFLQKRKTNLRYKPKLQNVPENVKNESPVPSEESRLAPATQTVGAGFSCPRFGDFPLTCTRSLPMMGG